MNQKQFEQDLVSVLRSHQDLSDFENRVLKEKAVDLALKNDEVLLKLLLEREAMKDHFFTTISMKDSSTVVFDKDKFINFMKNKEFLQDSYTAFGQKIGFSIGGDLLRRSKEVSLVWPYKDCVLAGGMTKEDQKRDEIFYNKTLAPDEVLTLLEPKGLTNFKRIDKHGEHRVKELKDDENLIIKGNNLLALHTLKERFRGQVKLIYIDPPYYFKDNKAGDTFTYNATFKLSTWLTFMKNRLEIAKDLLKDDGLIFIQINDEGYAYLKVLMDEIFENNFVTNICVQMSYVSGEKMAHIDKKPPKIKENLLFYAKDKRNVSIKPQYTETEIDKEYNKFIRKNNSENPEDWEVVPLTSVFKENKITDEEAKEEFMLENADLIFNRVRNKSATFRKTLGNKKMQKIKTPTGLEKWAWNGREAIFLSSRVVEDYEGNKTYQQALGDIWYDTEIVNLYLEGGVTLIGGKKPESLLKRIIDMSTKKEDIVMDFFLGSGTTAAVAHKMGRQYIGIEQLDYGKNDSVVRLKNVINGDQSGISKKVNWQGGGNFVYCELAKWNQRWVEKIEKAETSDELVDIWNDLKENAFLNYKVDIKKVNEHLDDFRQLSVDEQKEFLMETLDMNQLYVNASEIDDKTYDISEEDKKINRQFRGE